MITTQITNSQLQFQPLTNLRHDFVARNNLSSPVLRKQLSKDTISFKSNGKKEIAIREMRKEYKDIKKRGVRKVKNRFHSMDAYKKALDNFEVKKFIRLGMESAVFELDNGDILKLSCEEYPDYMPKYHAPEVGRGTIKLPQKYNAIDKYRQQIHIDEVYYVIQKKGVPITDISEAHKLFVRAAEDNLCVYDFDAEQFAYFDTPHGKVIKCVDLGCITNKSYPLLRNIKAAAKMPPEDACKPGGFLYRIFDDGYHDEQLRSFLKMVETRLKAGENIFAILTGTFGV